MLRVASIASVAGEPRAAQPTLSPPFRAPHHTTSAQALVGGGTRPRPGEISLAHRGVLFLDELPEFSRGALEALREPLESGVARISRVHDQLAFPAEFHARRCDEPLLVRIPAATARIAATARPTSSSSYRGRISGPLLDRFDLHVEVPRVIVRRHRRADGARRVGALRDTVVAARANSSSRAAAASTRGSTRARCGASSSSARSSARC